MKSPINFQLLSDEIQNLTRKGFKPTYLEIGPDLWEIFEDQHPELFFFGVRLIQSETNGCLIVIEREISLLNRKSVNPYKDETR